MTCDAAPWTQGDTEDRTYPSLAWTQKHSLVRFRPISTPEVQLSPDFPGFRVAGPITALDLRDRTQLMWALPPTLLLGSTARPMFPFKG